MSYELQSKWDAFDQAGRNFCIAYVTYHAEPLSSENEDQVRQRLRTASERLATTFFEYDRHFDRGGLI